MCAPAAVIAAVSAIAAQRVLSTRQPQTTGNITTNAPPPTRITRSAAMGTPEADRLKKEDEEIKVTQTTKQKKDRRRVALGTKTLGAVNPLSSNLPSAPAMGIAGTPKPTT